MIMDSNFDNFSSIRSIRLHKKRHVHISIYKNPNLSTLLGIATRKCNLEGVWEPPNLINCTTETFLNASSQVSFDILI